MATEAKRKPRNPPSASSRARKNPRKQQGNPAATPSRAASEDPPNDPEGASPGKKTTPVETSEDSKGLADSNENLRDPGAAQSEGEKKSGIQRKDMETAEGHSDGLTSHKKVLFERVWSKEDEIKLLHALIHCQEEYGVEPSSSVDLIHRHLRVNLNMEFARTQVYEKIRRLKQKFEAAVNKRRGDLPGPIKPHDQAVFELSQKIWKLENVPHPVKAASGEEEAAACSAHPLLGEVIAEMAKESACFAGSRAIKRGFKLLNPSKAEELEERWRIHRLEGMKYLVAGCELKSEILNACIEALNGHAP